MTSLRDFVWPDSGVLDSATAEVLSVNPTTAMVADTSVDSAAPQLSSRITGSLDALAFDTSAAAALAATGSEPQVPSYIPDDTAPTIDIESRSARRQDALGAMA